MARLFLKRKVVLISVSFDGFIISDNEVYADSCTATRAQVHANHGMCPYWPKQAKSAAKKQQCMSTVSRRNLQDRERLLHDDTVLSSLVLNHLLQGLCVCVCARK